MTAQICFITLQGIPYSQVEQRYPKEQTTSVHSKLRLFPTLEWAILVQIYVIVCLDIFAAAGWILSQSFSQEGPPDLKAVFGGCVGIMRVPSGNYTLFFCKQFLVRCAFQRLCGHGHTHAITRMFLWGPCSVGSQRGFSSGSYGGYEKSCMTRGILYLGSYGTIVY